MEGTPRITMFPPEPRRRRSVAHAPVVWALQILVAEHFDLAGLQHVALGSEESRLAVPLRRTFSSICVSRPLEYENVFPAVIGSLKPRGQNNAMF